METNELSVEDAVAKLRALAQPETASEETTPEDEPQQESEETLEAVSEPEETDVNPEEGEPSEPEEVSEQENDEPGAESIEIEADQFAEILNLKQDQLIVDDEGVKFRATPKGSDPVDVTLEQLINAFQGEATLTNRSKEIATLEKQQQEKLQEMAEQSNQFAQQSAAILEALKDKFVNPYSKEELAELREYDAAEYAARKEEIRDREKEFNNLVKESLNLHNESQTKQDEEFKAQYGKWLEGEQKKVREAISDWEKTEKATFDYAIESGFTQDELSHMADSRLLIMLHKAMMFDKGKKGAETKKVLKKPRIVKSGARPPKGQANLDAAKKAQSRLQETGSVDDAVALLRATRRS